MRYFFYGTLLDREVRCRVLGQPYRGEGEAARLVGYRRVHAPGKCYPTLVAAAHAIDGLLVEVPSQRQRNRLRLFEGDEFREAWVDVLTAAGRTTCARLFLARRQPAVLIDWSLVRWQRVEKQRFIRCLEATECHRRRVGPRQSPSTASRIVPPGVTSAQL